MSFPVYLTGGKGQALPRRPERQRHRGLGADGSFQGRQLAIGWSDGFVYYPAQLCMNASGEAYLADRGNNRVQIFATTR